MTTRPPQPNIIVLVPHDTGQFISPYGAETVNTPACERLAAESVRFANHFCTSPLCSPARAALFTGRYPHQNGIHGLVMGVTGGFDLAHSPSSGTWSTVSAPPRIGKIMGHFLKPRE
jgi:arylsulfatase A-like enzyme